MIVHVVTCEQHDARRWASVCHHCPHCHDDARRTGLPVAPALADESIDLERLDASTTADLVSRLSAEELVDLLALVELLLVTLGPERSP